MNRFKLLSSLCLLAGLSSAHASSFGPLSDGFNISVGSTSLNQLAASGASNLSYNSLTGKLTFSDGFSNYTFAEATAPGLVDALSVTRLCLAVNLGGCSASTVSISDASLLNGTLNLYLAAKASLSLTDAGIASVGATLPSGNLGTSTLTFGSTATLGLQTEIVGTQPSSLPVNSPVPEPGTMSLVLSGALGLAAAARRRLLAS